MIHRRSEILSPAGFCTVEPVDGGQGRRIQGLSEFRECVQLEPRPASLQGPWPMAEGLELFLRPVQTLADSVHQCA